jgi:hypothetical protein
MSDQYAFVGVGGLNEDAQMTFVNVEAEADSKRRQMGSPDQFNKPGTLAQ